MPISTIQSAIADDYKIFRDGIRVAFKNRDNIKMIWEAEDFGQMMQKLKQKPPDVLLTDLEILGTDVIKNIQLIKKDKENLKIVIIGVYTDSDTITQVMENGANAYLKKTTNANEIYKAIVTCMKDDFYFNDLVNEALVTKLQQNSAIKKKYTKLIKFNDKELKILKLISEDKTTVEISAEVFLSPRTVETIRQNMKTKVGARTIAGLLMYAIRNKFICGTE